MKKVFNQKGSAIIMAMLTVTVLLVLGLAVTTMSMGTLRTNAADATTNDAYYAAEAGVNSAIEQIRHEVSTYYAAMADATGATYEDLYNNFFPNIASLAGQKFAEPTFKGISTNTSFSVGSYDADTQAGEIAISSTSTTTNGTKYRVDGSVLVKRLDLRGGSWFVENTVIYAGGAIDLDTNRGMGAYGADVVAGELRELNASPWYSRFNHTGGTLFINPQAGDALTDVVSFTYSPPALPSDSPPTMLFTKDTTYQTSRTSPYTCFTTTPGVNVAFHGGDGFTGTVHGRGNVSFSSVGTITGDIYVDGNLKITGGGPYNVNIFCNGNVEISNATVNGLVMAKGRIDVYGGSSVLSMYAKGPIAINNASASGGVIYSSAQVSFNGGSYNSIVYSVGDVVIHNGCSIYGALFTKGNIYYTGNYWLSVTYNQSVVSKALADSRNAILFSGSGGGGSTVVDASVILRQSVTAAGRQ